MPELCARLGEALGLDGPAPESVLLRAADDPGFADDLLTCRGTPGFLRALFEAPATRAYERESPGAAAPGYGGQPEPAGHQHSTRELAGRAATAFVRWGKAGFTRVDEETLGRREAACLACPHLQEPSLAAQRAIPAREADRLGQRTGHRVCGLCGCNVGKKMRLPTESCPGPHPTEPGLTRWGEPHRPAGG
jgi:hypothetical protein